MRILITNDDGIDAPGIAIMEAAARTLTDDVWTVAPASEQSGQSRAVTLSAPLRMEQRDARRFAVAGTPADCITMALNVALDRKPDLVLSGVNQGFNVADDVLYSGTVGAAMQAASVGVRAMAFSQAYRRIGQEMEKDIWPVARECCADTLRRLLALKIDRRLVLNVNFPAVAVEDVVGLMVTRKGSRLGQELFTDDRDDGRGQAYHWVRFRREPGEPEPGTDLAALASGAISVTPLGADLTAHNMLEPLSSALSV